MAGWGQVAKLVAQNLLKSSSSSEGDETSSGLLKWVMIIGGSALLMGLLMVALLIGLAQQLLPFLGDKKIIYSYQSYYEQQFRPNVIEDKKYFLYQDSAGVSREWYTDNKESINVFGVPTEYHREKMNAKEALQQCNDFRDKNKEYTLDELIDKNNVHTKGICSDSYYPIPPNQTLEVDWKMVAALDAVKYNSSDVSSAELWYKVNDANGVCNLLSCVNNSHMDKTFNDFIKFEESDVRISIQQANYNSTRSQYPYEEWKTDKLFPLIKSYTTNSATLLKKYEDYCNTRINGYFPYYVNNPLDCQVIQLGFDYQKDLSTIQHDDDAVNFNKIITFDFSTNDALAEKQIGKWVALTPEEAFAKSIGIFFEPRDMGWNGKRFVTSIEDIQENIERPENKALADYLGLTCVLGGCSSSHYTSIENHDYQNIEKFKYYLTLSNENQRLLKNFWFDITYDANGSEQYHQRDNIQGNDRTIVDKVKDTFEVWSSNFFDVFDDDSKRKFLSACNNPQDSAYHMCQTVTKKEQKENKLIASCQDEDVKSCDTLMKDNVKFRVQQIIDFENYMKYMNEELDDAYDEGSNEGNQEGIETCTITYRMIWQGESQLMPRCPNKIPDSQKVRWSFQPYFFTDTQRNKRIGWVVNPLNYGKSINEGAKNSIESPYGIRCIENMVNGVDQTPNVPCDGGSKFHLGTDVSAKGDNFILAPAGGTVMYVNKALRTNDRRGYFVHIELDPVYDGAGNQYRVWMWFYHVSTILVAKGDHFTQGQHLAVIGNTGGMDNTGKPTPLALHLHFGMRVMLEKDSNGTYRMSERNKALMDNKSKTIGSLSGDAVFCQRHYSVSQADFNEDTKACDPINWFFSYDGTQLSSPNWINTEAIAKGFNMQQKMYQ